VVSVVSCKKSRIGSKTAPTGGYILYDCDADNEKGNADNLKSSECGWRYIEVAPTEPSVMFEIRDKVTKKTETGIGFAKENTEILAVNSTLSTDAAVASLNYKVTNNGIVYEDWYLPTKDELHLMVVVLHKKGGGDFSDNYYWSSSVDFVDGKACCWDEYFHAGKQTCDTCGFGYQVRPIRYYK
jgi:hypothetical protein